MEITLNENNIIFKGSEAKLCIVLDKSSKLDNCEVYLYPKSNSKRKEGLNIDWPGEFEASQILIKALGQKVDGKEFRHFLFEIEGTNYSYVANSSEKLSSKTLDLLSQGDVLILNSDINAKTALDIVETIEPNEIVIIGKENPENLALILKEISQENLESVEKIVLKKTELENPTLNYHLLSS